KITWLDKREIYGKNKRRSKNRPAFKNSSVHQTAISSQLTSAIHGCGCITFFRLGFTASHAGSSTSTGSHFGTGRSSLSVLFSHFSSPPAPYSFPGSRGIMAEKNCLMDKY
ncbi:MAG: hypothetical protein ACOY81_04355, partial [Bacillota bacterium]